MEKETKPICKFCKYKTVRNFKNQLLCKKNVFRDPLGTKRYELCHVKNQDYGCEDFEPKWIYKKRYKK